MTDEFRAAAQSIREEVLVNAWNPALGGFAGHYGGRDLDASLLQAAPLRFLPSNDPRLHGAIDAIRKGLAADGWLQRYRLDDGMGKPSVAFIVCTFWLIEALAVAGRQGEALALMNQIQPALSPLGLLSEDYATASPRMWGNFPQAYSHVGLIHAAFAASPTWAEVL